MAHGVSPVKRAAPKEKSGGAGSRRIFAPHFKLQVLDSYRNDADCKGNQRATARKYGIHRRQIQKWLQAEPSLRSSVGEGIHQTPEPTPMDLSLKRAPSPAPALDLSNKKPVKLFKPYLDDEEHKPPPPTRCAAACCNNNVMDYGGYTLHELQPAAAATPTTTTTYFYHPLPYYEDQCYMVKYKLQKWLKQEDEMR